MFEQDFAETQDLNLTMSQEDLKFMNITVGGIHKADMKSLWNPPTASQRKRPLTMQQKTCQS